MASRGYRSGIAVSLADENFNIDTRGRNFIYSFDAKTV
jgi:hypothetical protein